MDENILIKGQTKERLIYERKRLSKEYYKEVYLKEKYKEDRFLTIIPCAPL